MANNDGNIAGLEIIQDLTTWYWHSLILPERDAM